MAEILQCVAAVAHGQLFHFEIEVFDSEPQRFKEPQATSVEKLDDQLRRAGHRGDDPPDLVHSQNGGQPLGSIRSEGLDATLLLPEHLAVKEKQRVERLVLGGGCHVPIDRQVAQKPLNLLLAATQLPPPDFIPWK